ncbi:MAG: single-stranded-DNA-specific exonuclease RecJ [Clostridia bacterium]
MMAENWILRNRKADIRGMSEKYNLTPLTCRLMANRGILEEFDIASFLQPSMDKLHDPFLLKDMEKAVTIIQNGILANKKIRISGDYDQDGNAAVLTLYKGLKRCGAQVDYMIPHRIEDGYGINERMVESARDEGMDIIITCDNGITAFEAVETAKRLGIQTIITDHHDLAAEQDEAGGTSFRLPAADAVINPKRNDCQYPCKDLSGAGVAFKFVQALYDRMRIDSGEALEFLGFVAMGTVCDVVNLTGENRIIVKEGLIAIQNTRNIGLRALINVTGLAGKEITVFSLGFILGPCINASGRLDNARIAVDLMLTQDAVTANEYALRLYALNEERKAITQAGYENVLSSIQGSPMEGDDLLVIYEADLHESIAGIVAGRIKEKFFRPAIVLTDSSETGILKGSGRSLEGIDLFRVLSSCGDVIERFGGHPMAAGLSLKKENLGAFREKANCIVSETVDRHVFEPRLEIDARLPLGGISFRLVDELKILEPHGKGNPRPVFAERDLSVKRIRVMGKDRKAIGMTLLDKKGKEANAVYFGDAQAFLDYVNAKAGNCQLDAALSGRPNNILLDIAFYPAVNEYKGQKNLQIIVNSYR